MEEKNEVKVKVGKGATFQKGEEWTRVYYELEGPARAEDINAIKEYFSKVIDGWLKPTGAETPLPKASPLSSPAVQAKQQFPQDLQELLNFTEEGNFVIIKPRSFLGSDNFAKIAATVRSLGGEYVSKGRDSHFRIPKK